MSDSFSNAAAMLGSRGEQASAMLAQLLAAAQPGAVYSQPVAHGEYTIITASEVGAGGGFGFGLGFGTPAGPGAATQAPPGNGGGGSAGGGGSGGRPVAVIVIGPGGVEVKPVLDITKIGLVALATWGAALVALRKLRGPR